MAHDGLKSKARVKSNTRESLSTLGRECEMNIHVCFGWTMEHIRGTIEM